jgi:septal ring-binding cell division protein DamX
MATRENDTERALLPGALLVAAVLLILGAGFVLSTDAPKENRQAPGPPPPAATMPLPVPDVEAPAEAPRTVEEPAVKEPVPEPIPELSRRSADDLTRLGQSSGRYTAQLVVACKPETVDRLIAAAHGAKSLYVLPAQVKGQACFRVCWGSYGTQDDAARAADLPAALRSAERPRAVEIVSVLP